MFLTHNYQLILQKCLTQYCVFRICNFVTYMAQRCKAIQCNQINRSTEKQTCNTQENYRFQISPINQQNKILYSNIDYCILWNPWLIYIKSSLVAFGFYISIYSLSNLYFVFGCNRKQNPKRKNNINYLHSRHNDQPDVDTTHKKSKKP